MTLIAHPNRVFTREELIVAALGSDYEGFDRTVDSHIKNLRQKIETDTKNPVYILTIHGFGYKFGGV
jgi:DNA-binding response OmpR family regulator